MRKLFLSIFTILTIFAILMFPTEVVETEDTPIPTLTVDQKLLDLDQRIGAIENNNDVTLLDERVEDIEKERRDILSQLVFSISTNIVSLLVILFAVIIVFFLRNEIKYLIGSVDKIRVAGAEFSRSDVSNAIVDREILKAAILMAKADGHPDAKEMEHLWTLVGSMPKRHEDIPESDRRRVLGEAIIMSIADGTLDDDEYIALKNLSATLKLNVKILKTDIKRQYQSPQYKFSLPEELKKEIGLA